jgi:hypothetical protein
MTESEVIRIHTETFNRALKEQRYHELEGLYSDDYMLVRPDGSVLSKSEVLRDLREGGLTFHEIELFDVKVRIYGETAVLTGESRAVTSRAGKEAKSHSRLVAVYVARNRKLQLVHFQSVGL